MLHPPTSKKAHLAKESRTSHASSHIRRNLFFILTILLVILFSYVPEWLIYPDGDLPENWFLLRTATMSMVILIGAGLLLGVEALSKPSPPVKKANPQPEAEGEATMEEALGLQANQNTYIARVSHEIRNPMNTIMGFAEVLMNRELDPQSQAYARLIYRSSDDVIRLLSDIIDLNKVEEQKLSLERLSFDFKEVMASALLPFEYMAGKKDLLFETTFDEMPPFFWGDPHRIRQVLTNLVGNALKFTEEGKIKVHFHYQETAEGKPWIKTTISDTGIGIPTEKQKSVFQSFMQASDSTTRIYGGSGLGLNIVSQLVELMGGKCGVISPSPVPISVFGGVGSDFWFEIPLEVDTTQRSIEDLTMEVTPTDTHKLQQPVRVLVAEDNALNQLLFETFLTEMGAKVVLCKNGADAVETLRKDLRFDLVLMDVQMPVLDGLGASRKIREEISGTLPIIGCTAGAFPEDIEQCHQAGMNDFLPKPFRQKDLFEKVTHWVPELKTL